MVNTRDGKQLMKQECMVGDISASVHLVLWDNNVGALKENLSYKLTDVTVRMYDDIRYLSVSMQTIKNCRSM